MRAPGQGQWLERALPRSEPLQADIRAKALNTAGVIAGLQGDNDQADVWFAQSLPLWRQVGDITRVAATFSNLGLVAQQRNDLDRALELFREAQALYEQSDDQRGIAVAVGARAWLERQKDNHSAAVPRRTSPSRCSCARRSATCWPSPSASKALQR